MKKYRNKLELFLSEIKKVPGVVSVLIAGSLARDEADEYSDIDIEVYVDDRFDLSKEKHYQNEIFGLVSQENAEIDFFRFSEMASRDWEIAERWDKSQVRILFDTDNKMKKLLKEKVVWQKGEREKEMSRVHEYAYWYGNMVANVMQNRGDMISAHKVIDYSLDYLVQYLFLLNGKFVPHMKWRYNRVVNLEKVPNDLEKKMSQIIITKELNQAELTRRIKVFRNLLNEVEIIAGIK